MTRDEAKRIMGEASRFAWNDERMIDAFVALGMLKLDEPSNDLVECGGQIGKVRAFMRKFHLWEYSPGQLESALASCGLKIVEK